MASPCTLYTVNREHIFVLPSGIRLQIYLQPELDYMEDFEEHITDRGGLIAKDAIDAHFMILSPPPEDEYEDGGVECLTQIKFARINSKIALSPAWIIKCIEMNKIVSWYPFCLQAPKVFLDTRWDDWEETIVKEKIYQAELDYRPRAIECWIMMPHYRFSDIAALASAAWRLKTGLDRRHNTEYTQSLLNFHKTKSSEVPVVLTQRSSKAAQTRSNGKWTEEEEAAVKKCIDRIFKTRSKHPRCRAALIHAIMDTGIRRTRSAVETYVSTRYPTIRRIFENPDSVYGEWLRAPQPQNREDDCNPLSESRLPSSERLPANDGRPESEEPIEVDGPSIQPAAGPASAKTPSRRPTIQPSSQSTDQTLYEPSEPVGIKVEREVSLCSDIQYLGACPGPDPPENRNLKQESEVCERGSSPTKSSTKQREKPTICTNAQKTVIDHGTEYILISEDED